MNINVVKDAVKEFYSNPEYKCIIFLIDDNIIISKDFVDEIVVYYDTLKVTTEGLIIYYDISNIKIIKLSIRE